MFKFGGDTVDTEFELDQISCFKIFVRRTKKVHLIT